MRYVLDIETTTCPPEGWEEGKSLLNGNPSPFIPTNKCVLIGLHNMEEDESYIFTLEDADDIQGHLHNATVLIGHNIKFDLMWLRELGFTDQSLLYDTMITEYVLLKGNKLGLSLDECFSRYYPDEEGKKDILKERLKQGYNTDQIDLDKELIPYLIRDLIVTKKVYIKQRERL